VDKGKDEKQLVGEIKVLKERVAKLEKAKAERKKVEEQLRESGKKLSEIIQGSSIPTFVINKEHIITHWNKACENLTSIPAKDVIGHRKQWMIFFPSKRPVMADFVVDNASKEELARYFGTNYRKSTIIDGAYEAEGFFPYLGTGGKGKWIFFTASPLKNVEGKIIGAIETLQDITERKNVEALLRTAYTNLKATQSQLIQAEKMTAIGQLASGVAHEVRNPLAVIMQGVNYLEKKIPSNQKDTMEALNMMKDSVDRAADIVNSLLGFSRTSRSELSPEDINTVLENSLKLVQTRFKFGHIDIVNETKKGLPKVLIDKNKIEQVVINLVLNAVHAMSEKGKITIRSYHKQFKKLRNGLSEEEKYFFKPGEKVVMVEIEDTGVGISEEDLKKIFDPFFTTKSSTGGTGLGLSVSRNIIRMNKALIDVKSEVGKGTNMIITLKTEGGEQDEQKKNIDS